MIKQSQSSAPRITAAARNLLILSCLSAFPREACGLLAGTDGTITTILPIPNRHPQPDGFDFDPVEWVQACFRMQKSRLWLAGFYHSHPVSAAIPSVRDEQGYNGQEGSAYWIISLADPDNPIIQPYSRAGGSFIPYPLVIA